MLVYGIIIIINPYTAQYIQYSYLPHGRCEVGENVTQHEINWILSILLLCLDVFPVARRR